MLVEDLLNSEIHLNTREILTIKKDCSQYLKDSAELPLYKALPVSYKNLHRVKIRQQKRKDSVTEVFNNAFSSQFHNIRQRAVFAYAQKPLIHEGNELFYVFPINGYKFLYSKEVTNSSSDYKHVIDTLFENVDDINKANDLVTDLLRYTYSSENLYEGIISDSEIILYGVPYYYAVKVSSCQGYAKFLASK